MDDTESKYQKTNDEVLQKKIKPRKLLIEIVN